MNIDKNALKMNSELRSMARAQLKGNWGKVILAIVVFGVVSMVCGIIPYLGAIISLIISGPLALGLVGFYIKFVRNENPILENLFDGFKDFSRSCVLGILVAIFTLLWALLFIIPGIIAGLRYSMAFYILNDNPQMSASEALNFSKKMMDGQKGKLFMLGLSFIGWYLLACLTLGIGLLWLAPYMYTSVANFYEDLKGAAVSEPII